MVTFIIVIADRELRKRASAKYVC